MSTALPLRNVALALMLCAVGATWAADGNFRGRFYWGHEVESFSPCGSTKAYWVAGEESTLQPLRNRADELRLNRSKPYQPIYVEVIGVIDIKSTREGFAEDYDGFFRLNKVLRVSDLVPKGCGK